MLKSFVVGAMALVMVQAASAQQFYGLGSLGLSDFTEGEADNICRSIRECDRTGIAVKLIGGYKIMPSLAAEVGYWNYGRLTGKDGNFREDLEASAFGAGVAYHALVAPKWLGIARLGLAAVDAKVSNSNNFSAQESSAQIYGGLSLGYTLAPNVAIDGAWDFAFASVNGTTFEINAVSVGLRVGF